MKLLKLGKSKSATYKLNVQYKFDNFLDRKLCLTHRSMWGTSHNKDVKTNGKTLSNFRKLNKV